MKRKRSPTGHQKQMRFFTVFFGALMIILLVAMMWLMNRPHLANN